MFDFERVSFRVHLRVDRGRDGRSSRGGRRQAIGVHSGVEILGLGTEMDRGLHFGSDEITWLHNHSQSSELSLRGMVHYIHLVTIPSRQTILPSLSARNVLGVV